MSAPQILVVDDEIVVLRLCQAVLEREGYRVLAAVEPREALRMADPVTAVALAVIDIMLPSQSGCQLITSLKKAGMAGVFICMSGYPVGELPGVDEKELSSHYFLRKPFTPRQLVEIVATALRESGARWK